MLMNMLDGMDVMVIAYAAPSLAKAWTIEPGTLGVVFSAGLAGMTLGAMFLAPVADRIGRRRMIMTCIVVMGLGTLLTAYAANVTQMILLRLVSGLGIGAMLATSATMSAEFVPTRIKNFGVSIVFAGYPAGAVLSGLVAAWIIPEHGWQAIFVFAGVVTLATLLLVAPLLPESLEFLAKSGRADALASVNRVLARMRRAPLAALPADANNGEGIRRASVGALFAPSRRVATSWLWVAFFTAFATLYFLTSWIPKLASNTGLSMELAIYAGTVFNLGAFFGIVTQGWFSNRFGLRRVICIFLMATAALMVGFGLWQQPWVILLMFGLIGFGVQGGFVGLYAVAAWLYPVEIRNTGIGWGIGAGRLGAVFGPMAGGALVAIGLSMATNFIIFSVPLVIAGIATILVGRQGEA
jgi:benzoate transport